MHSVDREGHFSVGKSSGFEVEPTFGVTLIIGSFGIAGCPETVVIVGGFDDFRHVAGIEMAIEEDVGLSWLGELELVSLGEGVLLLG